MRNFTLTLATAALVATAAQAQTTQVRGLSLRTGKTPVHTAYVPTQKNAAVERMLRMKAAQAEDLKTVYLPQKDTLYAPVSDGTWEEDSYDSYTYDESGRVTEQLQTTGTGVTKIVNEYNADGLIAASTYYVDQGSGFQPSIKQEYTYDDVLKSYLTASITSTNSNGTWTPVAQYCSKHVIERNADGNITSVTEKILTSKDTYADYSILTLTYDDGAKQPTGYSYGETTSLGTAPAVSETMTDLVWERCTGQVTEPFSVNWFTSKNFLSTGTHPGSYYDTYVSTTHPEGDYFDFTMYQTYSDVTGLKTLIRRTTTDENGSYRFANYMLGDMYSFTDPSDDDIYYGWYEDVTYNEHGDLVSDEYYDIDEGGSLEEAVLSEGEKHEYKYGTQGEMLEDIHSILSDGETDYTTYSRTTYGDFKAVTFSGISSATAQTTDGAAAVYSLQGAKVGTSVEGLPAGIYVVRQGGKTFKVARR